MGAVEGREVLAYTWMICLGKDFLALYSCQAVSSNPPVLLAGGGGHLYVAALSTRGFRSATSLSWAHRSWSKPPPLASTYFLAMTSHTSLTSSLLSSEALSTSCTAGIRSIKRQHQTEHKSGIAARLE